MTFKTLVKKALGDERLQSSIIGIIEVESRLLGLGRDHDRSGAVACAENACDLGYAKSAMERFERNLESSDSIVDRGSKQE